MNKTIGLTSRGDDDEKIRYVADLLHAEEHAVETLKKEPHKVEELTKNIDNLRGARQDAVRLWAGENVNPNYWCMVKHLTENSRRADELIENASRLNPGEVPKLIKIAKRIEKEKDNAIRSFKAGKTKISDEECFRCEDDLGGKNYKKIKNILSQTKSLNSSSPKEINNSNSLGKNKKNGGISMTDFKRLGVINGGQFAGKGITVLADYIDKKFPATSTFKKKGLWMNVGVGLLGQVVALYAFKKKDNLQLLTLIASSHALTKVVDYAREAVAPTVGARLPPVRGAPLRVTPRTPVMGANSLVIVD